MITDEFKAEVLELREEGWTWPEVAQLTGRSQRTCHRAFEQHNKTCARRGCDQPVVSHNGRLCSEHHRAATRFKPGQGVRQQTVMKEMRKHGRLTSEELRNLTGLDTSNLGQILGRLVRLGLLERPMKGHYTMPRPDNLKPQHPIAPTPDKR